MTSCGVVDPVELVRSVIETWCARRELRPLSVVLPGYLAFNGLTDGWAALLEALDDVRVYYAELPDGEVDALRRARAAAFQALKGR